jgi:hypothetical protein
MLDNANFARYYFLRLRSVGVNVANRTAVRRLVEAINQARSDR